MERKKSFGSKLEHFFTGKGFYIVLFLCIAVIGVSAWIMLFYDKDEENVGADSAFSTEVIASSPQAEERIPLVQPETQEPENDTETLKTEPQTAEINDEKTEQVAAAEPESETVPVAAVAKSYIWPVSGDVSVGYSVDALVFNKTMNDWRTHDGIDISAKVGTKVLAIADGTVENVYNDDLFGTTVVIDHGNGVLSVYSNMAGTPTVNAGDAVSLGDVIGSVGSTSLVESAEKPHLHLTMKKDGATVDPLDYMPKKLG